MLIFCNVLDFRQFSTQKIQAIIRNFNAFLIGAAPILKFKGRHNNRSSTYRILKIEYIIYLHVNICKLNSIDFLKIAIFNTVSTSFKFKNLTIWCQYQSWDLIFHYCNNRVTSNASSAVYNKWQSFKKSRFL